MSHGKTPASHEIQSLSNSQLVVFGHHLQSDRSTALFDVSTSDLLLFKDSLELSPEAFREITGVNFHNYRRGRLKKRVSLEPRAAAAIGRCVGTYSLALELCNTHERALDWLYSECPQLENEQPIDLADSEEGYARITRFVARLRELAGVSSKRASSPPVPVEAPRPQPKPLEKPCTLPTQTPFHEKLEVRSFRIRQRLIAEIERAKCSRAEIARKAQEQGALTLSPARISHLSHGYDATGQEVLSLARVFGISPADLVEGR